MKKWIIALLVLVTTACAGVNLNQQIKAGQLGVTDYRARTERLYDRGIIDNATAQKRLNQVKLAQTGLDTARTALSLCTVNNVPEKKCTDAQIAANSSQAALNAIGDWLIEQEATKK